LIVAHGRLASHLLRRIIQKFVREPLADYLLKKNPAMGTKVTVAVNEQSLKFSAT